MAALDDRKRQLADAEALLAQRRREVEVRAEAFAAAVRIRDELVARRTPSRAVADATIAAREAELAVNQTIAREQQVESGFLRRELDDARRAATAAQSRRVQLEQEHADLSRSARRGPNIPEAISRRLGAIAQEMERSRKAAETAQSAIEELSARRQKAIEDARRATTEARKASVEAGRALERAARIVPVPTPELRAAETAVVVAREALDAARQSEREAHDHVTVLTVAVVREELGEARTARDTLAGAAARTAAAADLMARTRRPDDVELRAAREERIAAERRLAAARFQERSRKERLADSLYASLPPDPEGDIARLDADCPILLFPVRIETRFTRDGTAATELKIRIFPDEILANEHDSRLTSAEVAAAHRFWTDAWNPAAEEDAWRTLVRSYPPPRAAWIVRATTPLNVADRTAPPVFPDGYGDPAASPASLARAAEAHLLPDRWLVLAYRAGVEIRRAVSRAVVAPLTLIPDPEALDDELVQLGGQGGPPVDRGVLWAYDFTEAEKRGMALRMPVDATDLAEGFDRLLVVGVQASLPPIDGAAALAALIDNHHYGAGLELVPQGTPTNNTSVGRSGFPPDDDGGSRSFMIERRAAVPGEGTDGQRLMRAFGLPARLAAGIAGATRTEEQNARAMNTALWPSTFGYALDQMMRPAFTPAAIADGREYFINHVRGRGPLPAFRVGASPYGVLPVTSLSRWEPHPESTRVDRALPDALRRLRDRWRSKIGLVPHVGRTPGDPDRDLLEILGMTPSAHEIRVRGLQGAVFHRNLFGLLGLDETDWQQWSNAQRAVATQVLGIIGHPEWSPRVLEVAFDGAAYAFGDPLVTAPPLSESDALPGTPNYLGWIRTASVDELRALSPAATPNPAPLLFLMMCHGALLEYAAAALGLHAPVIGRTASELASEPELVGVAPGTADRPNVWQWLDRPVSGVTTRPVKEHLRVSRGRPETRSLDEFRGALAHLEQLPTAELDRLLTETLDTCSHRLDTWITSLPAKRLEEIRARQGPTDRLVGSHIGAFAWVENLRPSQQSAGMLRAPNAVRVRTQPLSGGYIHGPSIAHAAAAGILRNGYMSHSTSRSTYAIDLCSSRVRQALELLDALRNGLPLSAILGYRFERALHDRRLDVYIEPLRSKYPMPVLTDLAAGEARESVGARDVLNGWDLYLAPDPFSGLSVAPDDRAALQQEFQRLRDHADAVADLLTAEAVYQIVRGNMPSAATSLDALSKGARPPDPEIAHAPRSGTALTHRTVIVLGGEAIAPREAWAPTPRAIAEPYLNRWAERLLGDPRRVRCRVSYLDPTVADPTRRTDTVVSLSDLGLSALDVLALARGAAGAPTESELDRRVTYIALGAAPETTDVRITYAADPAWDRTVVRTVPELLEVARALNEVVSMARPLAPADLMLPESRTTVSAADVLPDEIYERAVAARDALEGARRNLSAAYESILDGADDLTPLRVALVEAALFGIAGSMPETRRGNDFIRRGRLLGQSESVLRELKAKLDRAFATRESREIARAVFGEDFLLLPRFRLVEPAELVLALAEGPALIGDSLELVKWMQSAARVHPGLARLRRLGSYCASLGTPLPGLEVAQLPHVSGARWVGLPFSAENERPPSGRLSIVMHREEKPAANEPWVGLLLDEWSELIPNPTETTGVAFHYDDPGAEAAQTVLIAVPPSRTRKWDLNTLVDILHETFDLAKIRGVDLEMLGELGQLLPAAYLAANAGDDTIRVRFAGRLVADPMGG